MSTVDNIGVISIIGKQVHWTLYHFFSLPQSVDTEIISPYFSFNDMTWRQKIWPNGEKHDGTEGWFGLSLANITVPVPPNCVRVIIKDIIGQEIYSSYASWNSDSERSELKIFVKRTELDSEAEALSPDGHLRIICEILLDKNKSVEVATQKNFERGLEKLSQDFKELCIKGKHCDLTISVKDRVFHAHRGVLMSRSPVFEAMLSHDMAEKQDGVISIEDCDPDVFGDFLLYLYTGRVENVSQENVQSLYYAADKYDLPNLKEICLQCMKDSLSTEIITDVVQLAARHNEFELLDLATNFFVTNMRDIFLTEKWLEFMQKNPLQANELLIRVFKVKETPS